MAMTHDPDSKLRVLIAGGGVAALEAALALRELAAEKTAVTGPDRRLSRLSDQTRALAARRDLHSDPAVRTVTA